MGKTAKAPKLRLIIPAVLNHKNSTCLKFDVQIFASSISKKFSL